MRTSSILDCYWYAFYIHVLPYGVTKNECSVLLLQSLLEAA